MSALSLRFTLDTRAETRIFAVCSIIALIAAGAGLVWLMSGQSVLLRFIGAHYSQIFFAAQATTAVACFIYGFVILLLRTGAASAEKWAKYLGWAFIALCMQYCVLVLLRTVGYNSKGTTMEIVGTMFSMLNNTLFVASGLALLDRPKAFPRWNWMTQCVFAILGVLLSALGTSYSRFPDAIASAFCFLWIGYSLSQNVRSSDSIIPRRIRTAAGRLVVAAMVSYGCAGVLYATGPFLVRSQLSDVPWMAQVEEAAQAEDAKRFADLRANRQEIAAVKPPNDKFAIRQTLLDSAVVSFVFILKFIIFNAAFFLMVGAIIFLSSDHANEIFKSIVAANGEFLTNSGITQFMAKKLNAELVELFVKYPGRSGRSFARFAWPPGELAEGNSTDNLARLNESEIDELSRHAVQTGEEQRLPEPEGDRLRLASLFPFTYASRLPSRVAIPMRFHGAVVGCISVSRKTDFNFSPKEIQYIRNLSKLSILSVQSFREKSALDQLSPRFSRLTLKPIEDFHKALDEVTEILHDVLNPFATGLWVDAGLQEGKSLAGELKYKERLQAWVENNGRDSKSLKRDAGLDALMIDLVVKLSPEANSETYKIGKLALLVRSYVDDTDRPVLGKNPTHFRAIAARTTSVVLGVVLAYLSSIMRDLGVKSDGATSVEDWFSEVETAAAKARFLWVAAELPYRDRLLGEQRAIDALRVLQSQDGEADGNYLKSEILRQSNATLWFAIRGSSYHQGKDISELWKPSLSRLGEMIDSSLNRIMIQQERDALQASEAAMSYEFATIAVTTTEIIHQIVNNTRDIVLPLQVVAESLRVGKLECRDKRLTDLIGFLPVSATSLLALTADFKKLSDPGHNQTCNLRNATLQAERLFALSLKHGRILLETDIPDSLVVAVPPHVAIMAIANLLGNSKDELVNGGHIRISAREEDNMIRCDVIDDGQGVSPEVRGGLFQKRNLTTKTTGRGWGLYLVSLSLKDRHGSVELTDPGPGSTTFTIRFPKHTNGKNK